MKTKKKLQLVIIIGSRVITSSTLDAKITQKKLVNESGLNGKIKALATKEEMKTLAINTELKSEQDKIVKFQTYDLSLCIVQSYFINDIIMHLKIT